jgi:hypothetical protein
VIFVRREKVTIATESDKASSMISVMAPDPQGSMHQASRLAFGGLGANVRL